MLTNRQYKNLIWDQFARMAKGLASPRRLELLDLLAQGPRTVEALAQLAGLSVANASQHLQVLKGAALVTTERQGTYVTYRLAAPEVEDLLGNLRHLAEAQIAEVAHLTRTFLGERHLLEPVDQDLLMERVRTGEVTVLDVRPLEEYQAGHIPGALSVPLPELKQRLARIPKNREVVAYCRGPYCVLAVEAVALLQTRGFQAHRLEAGVPDWRACGHPVAVGGDPSRQPPTRRTRIPKEHP